MAIEIGKRYKLNFKVGRQLLYYSGLILNIDLDKVTFKERDGLTLTFLLADLIRFKELE